MKIKLKVIFRFLVTITLIIYILTKIDLSELFTILSEINLLLFATASFLYIASSYISTLRWRLFLPSTPDLTKDRLFSLYMIGCFFNIFLPGLMGGDVVKVILMSKSTGLKEAVVSVFIERYIGFFSLLLLGITFFFIFYEYIPKNEIVYIVPLSFIFFLFGTIILYLSGKISFLRDVKEYIFRFDRRLFYRAFIYSIFVQLAVMVSVYVVFLSLNVTIKFYEIVIYLPLIIILSTLPISVSGIGVREWGFLTFFGGNVGNEKALAVSILWFLSIALASLYGGIEYLRFKDFINVHYKK